MAEQGAAMTFDEILADKEYQSEFDRRVSKALDTAKEKWDTEKKNLAEQLKTAQNGLAAANTEIESYKGMDIDGIKRSASEWEQKAAQFKADAEKAQQEAAQKIAAVEYDNALNGYVAGLKFSSEYAKKGFVEDFKAKGFKLEDGKFLGADDYVKGVQEKDPGTFTPDENAPKMTYPTGAIHGMPPTSGGDQKFNFSFTPVRKVPNKE